LIGCETEFTTINSKIFTLKCQSCFEVTIKLLNYG